MLLLLSRLKKKIATFGASVVSAVAKNNPIVVDNVGPSFGDLDSINSAPKELNPSSEAEALSNVASGIAASLGLVAEAASVVAAADFAEMNHSANSTSSVGPLSGNPGTNIILNYVYLEFCVIFVLGGSAGQALLMAGLNTTFRIIPPFH